MKSFFALRESLAEQVTFGKYTTMYFDMCPSARELYSKIDSKTNMVHLVIESLMLHDLLFRLEKQLVGIGYAELDDIQKAEQFAQIIMYNAKLMNLVKQHSYIKTHLDAIRSLHTTNGLSQ